MLSRALRASASSSSLTSTTTSAAANAYGVPLNHSQSSSVLLELDHEQLEDASPQELGPYSLTTADGITADKEEDEEALFLSVACEYDEGGLAHTSITPPRPPFSRPIDGIRQRPIPGAVASEAVMAIPRSYSVPMMSVPVARSCPKPIVMNRKGRQSSFQHDLDDLDEFVPPHEIAASSYMDPTNVAESLCRKGSHVLRMRSGVLRRTGYLEGHTETLRSIKQ